MRRLILAAALTSSACALPAERAPVVTTTLVSADASTSLMVGDQIFLEQRSEPAREGMDRIVNITLRHNDGRRIAFHEANHAPHDLFVQRPNGALAQVMALGEAETPRLYHAASGEGAESAFFCGPQGPAAIGMFESADGAVRIVGLRQPFQVETLANGELNAVPYSPDQVCARLNFRRS
nr:hypothetical protein [uncultured bacterium]